MTKHEESKQAPKEATSRQVQRKAAHGYLFKSVTQEAKVKWKHPLDLFGRKRSETRFELSRKERRELGRAYGTRLFRTSRGITKPVHFQEAPGAAQ